MVTLPPRLVLVHVPTSVFCLTGLRNLVVLLFLQINYGIVPQFRQEGFIANLACEMSIHESTYDSTQQTYNVRY
jgi:hypothetical protein